MHGDNALGSIRLSVCPSISQCFGDSGVRALTDRRTDRQTDIRTQAIYDLHGRVFLMCYSQWYEGTFCTTNFSYV